MDRAEIHELSAAYALDALGPAELEAYEEHLARCAECQASVAHFQAVAAELAHDVHAPAPPSELRERLLTRAAAERPKLVPLRRRRWAYPAAAAAVAASAAAVGLGLWAADLSRQLDEERTEAEQAEDALDEAVGERSELIPLQGAEGVLVVNEETGRGSLVIEGLEEAPAEKTYEAWVIEGEVARAAGLFAGGEDRTIVPLRIPVPEGAIVAVTIEDEGGVDQPTQQPFITAQTS